MPGLTFNNKEIKKILFNGTELSAAYFNGVKFWPLAPSEVLWSIVNHSFQGVLYIGNPPLLTNNMPTLGMTSTIVDVGLGWPKGFLGLGGQEKFIARSENGGQSWVERDYDNNTSGVLSNPDTAKTIFAGPPFNFLITDRGMASFDGKVWKYAGITTPRDNGSDPNNIHKIAGGGFVRGTIAYTRNKIYLLSSGKVSLYDGYLSNNNPALTHLGTYSLPAGVQDIISAGSSDWNGIVDHCVGVSLDGKVFSVEENRIIRQLPTINGRAYAGIVGTNPHSDMPALILSNASGVTQGENIDYFRWSKSSKTFEKISPNPPSGYTDLKILWPGIWCQGPNLYVAVARARKPDGTFFWGLAYSSDGLNWELFKNVNLGRESAATYNTQGCRFSFDPITRRLVFVRYQAIGTSQGFITTLP